MCDRSYSKKKDCENHIKAHSGVKPLSCPICNKGFILQKSYKYHITTHEPVDNTHQCEICHKNYRTNASLREHITIHTGEKKYKCNICGECFRIAHRLREHKLIHTAEGEDAFTCKVCRRMFSNLYGLKRHMVIHESKENKSTTYSCDQCDKVYTRKNSLSRHKRSHSDLRPYSCEVRRKRMIVYIYILYNYRMIIACVMVFFRSVQKHLSVVNI